MNKRLHNELIYRFTGKSACTFNNKTCIFEGSTVMFLPKGIDYTFVVEEPGDCIDIFFNFPFEPPDSKTGEIIKTDNPGLFLNLFTNANKEWTTKEAGYYSGCIATANRILSVIQQSIASRYIPKSSSDKISKAVEYIHEHYQDSQIDFAYLAELSGISVSYFRQLFSLIYKMPPAKYINLLKINKAKDLLMSGLYSVSEISDILGYSNIYYFSRFFKNETGKPPSNFKPDYKPDFKPDQPV
ncbi:MAG: AraC family transcriptional regulator [Eubacteriales bacterium]|nr:AraC family transcriptional regulator [Eubacteriales bacterium]